MGGVTGRHAMELAQLEGNLTLTAQYRTAVASTRAPGPWTTFGSTLTAVDQKVNDVALSGITDQFWIQFAIGKQSSSAGEGLVTLRSTLLSDGAVVGARTIALANATLNASSAGVFEIGAPFPAVGLTGLMFGYEISGVGAAGALSGNAMARVFEGDPVEPSSTWSTLSSGSFSVSSSTPVARSNSGVLTPPTTTGNTWCQAGIAINGSNPQATVRVIVGAVYG